MEVHGTYTLDFAQSLGFFKPATVIRVTYCSKEHRRMQMFTHPHFLKLKIRTM